MEMDNDPNADQTGSDDDDDELDAIDITTRPAAPPKIPIPLLQQFLRNENEVSPRIY
jgi:hypothetical protein